MEEQNKPIELRSEKVRNVIGRPPSFLLNYGIIIIGLAILIMIIASAIIPYQPTFKTQITVNQKSTGALIYTADIPEKALKNKAQISVVEVATPNALPLPARYMITNISSAPIIADNNTYYTASLQPIDKINNEVQLKEAQSIPAKISMKKRSFLKWILQKVDTKQ